MFINWSSPESSTAEYHMEVLLKRFVHANRLVFFLAALVTATHFPDDFHCAEISQATLTSAYSEVSAKACNTEIDKSDPNETPYQVCPGVLDFRPKTIFKSLINPFKSLVELPRKSSLKMNHRRLS